MVKDLWPVDGKLRVKADVKVLDSTTLTKVGEHKRRAFGEVYISPRIVLPSKVEQYLGRIRGKKILIVRGDFEVEYERWWNIRRCRGSAMILILDEEVETDEEEFLEEDL